MKLETYPPAKVANLANRGSGKTLAIRGYQRLTLSREMRVGDLPPAKVANLANRGEDEAGVGTFRMPPHGGLSV